MQVDDLTVEVRNVSLARVGQITGPFLDLKARIPWCGVGEWTVTLPGDHPMVPFLAAPGAGIIVQGPGPGGTTETLFSGPSVAPKRVRNRVNPDGTYTISGVTDEVILQGALAFPDPSISDAQASSQSRTNDTRTGATQNLLRSYVAYNIANGAIYAGGATSHAPAGRLRGLRSKLRLSNPSQGAGVSQTKSPRFQNLLELLQEVVAFDPNYGFKVTQVGSYLEFTSTTSADLRSTIRFDIDNGTVASEEVSLQGSTLTAAIVAGQGEGKDRKIVTRTAASNTADEAAWGLVWERFIDQRQAEEEAVLTQKGDEELAASRGGKNAKIVPTDDTTMRLNVDWRAGDLVTSVADSTETTTRITEWVLLANSQAVMVGAGLGDISGLAQQSADTKKVQSLDERVSLLEKTGGLLPARLQPLGTPFAADLNNAKEFGLYRVDSSTLNSAVSTGIGNVLVLPAGDGTAIRQEFRRVFVSGTQDLRVWARTLYSGTWSPWVLIYEETEWIDLSSYLVGGFTASAGNVEGRRMGLDAEIRGSMSSPSLAASSTGVDFLSGLPTLLRPTKRIGFGTAINNGYANTAYARTDGTAAISLRNGLNGSTQFTIKYFLG